MRSFTERGIEYVAQPEIEIVHEEGLETSGEMKKVLIFFLYRARVGKLVWALGLKGFRFRGVGFEKVVAGF